MDTLTAIRILNATFTLGLNCLDFQKHVGSVLETAIANGDDSIPDKDWKWVTEDAKRNDARLARLIVEHGGDPA